MIFIIFYIFAKTFAFLCLFVIFLYKLSVILYQISGQILYNYLINKTFGGIKMQLFNGRPENEDGRLDKEIRVYNLLDTLGVEYQRVDHEPAMTMEACLEIDKALGATICKNLLLCNRQCTDFYLLLMPGDKLFKTKDLSAILGTSRLSFASGDMMESLLDITPGSLSVMGLMNDKGKKVRLVIDKAVLSGEYIGFHPCINTSSLKIKTKALMETLIPAMGHEPTIVDLPIPTEL